MLYVLCVIVSKGNKTYNSNAVVPIPLGSKWIYEQKGFVF